DFLAVVILRERKLERLGFARGQAARRGVEFRQHAAFADGEDEVLGLTSGEGLAIDRALEVDREPVAFLRRAFNRHETRALLAQDADRLLDGRIVHAHLRALDRDAGEIAALHFGAALDRRADLERGAIRSAPLFAAR